MRRFMYFNWLMSRNGIGLSGALIFTFARLLIAVIIILFFAFIFKNRSKIGFTHMDSNIPQHSNNLLQLLNERLVKGEITIEEYQRLKTEILNK